jgi:hypothetical protein
MAPAHAEGQVDPVLIDAMYKKLSPVKPERVLGEWDGGILDTAHSIGDTPKEI